MSYVIVAGPNMELLPYGAEQIWLVVSVRGKTYMVSHVDRAFDTQRPEYMAFECDEDGVVSSFGDVAVSYETDRNLAFDDVIAELERMNS